MNHDDVIAALSAIRDRERLGDIDVPLPYISSASICWDFLTKNGYVTTKTETNIFGGNRYILTFLGHVKLAAEKDKNETS